MAHPPELNDAQVLERQPVGASVTLRVLGGCMYPLFRSGDSVTVRRCEESDIGRGDVAVVKDAHGRFMAHLVVATGPVRTATFRGTEDNGQLQLLGRVTAIRRSPAVFPLPTIARPLVWLVHWLAMRMRQGRTSRSPPSEQPRQPRRSSRKPTALPQDNPRRLSCCRAPPLWP